MASIINADCPTAMLFTGLTPLYLVVVMECSAPNRSGTENGKRHSVFPADTAWHADKFETTMVD
jgi:hypothetical protein